MHGLRKAPPIVLSLLLGFILGACDRGPTTPELASKPSVEIPTSAALSVGSPVFPSRR